MDDVTATRITGLNDQDIVKALGKVSATWKAYSKIHCRTIVSNPLMSFTFSDISSLWISPQYSVTAEAFTKGNLYFLCLRQIIATGRIVLTTSALEIRDKSWRQKIAVAMPEFDSKSDVFPTNFSLEYMKSIY